MTLPRRNHMNFIQVLNDPETREMVDQIENLIDAKDAATVAIRTRLIAELKAKSGYEYTIHE